MNPTERFSNRVENYVKYRPAYPPEVVDLMSDEMDLAKDSIVADIGSGTGIFAKLLLEKGCQVFGVEPNAAMRAAAENFLREFSSFQSVAGTAEKTNLADNSVDFITAAQAFHWFDKAKTPAEFRRILRSNGYIVLIWNERQLDSTAFLREYERFLLEFGTDYKTVRHDQIGLEEVEAVFKRNFSQKTFQYIQTVDFTGLKGRVLSSSYIPTDEHPHFQEMLAALENLFLKYENKGKVDIIYYTLVFFGKL